MKKLFYNSSLSRKLRRLAKQNAAQGKPLCVMDDLVFKAMLTSDNEDSREALRSLLSACTRRAVSKVQVSNNDLIPPYLGGKVSRLDVHVIFNDGEAADLEMQIGKSNDDLKARATIYTAMLLSGQSRRGKLYKGIKRVYQIFFLNCILFPQSDKIPRRYTYREETEHDRLSETTEIIFYEMPKLEQRVLDFLDGKAGVEVLREDEKWCIFMRHRHEQQALPLIKELCREEEGIMRAEKALYKVDRDYEKFARNMAMIKNSMDRASFIADAKDEGRTQGLVEGRTEGLAKGLAEGLAKGLAKGLVEGRAEGEAKSKLEIARKMKNRGRPLAEILEDTGLSSRDIDQL